MTDLQKWLDDALVESTSKLMEDYILDVFGSKERVLDVAKFYAIKEEPVRVDFGESLFADRGYIKLRVTHEYKLRLKTPEELSKDRADAIIDEHTKVYPKCITCGDPIKGAYVHSRHGYYHDFPMTCIEGRP